MPSRLLILAVLLLAACARTPHASRPAINKYADATLRQIGTAQDERNATALLPFLNNPNPIYRREAALAFASVQEKVTSPFLLPLLRDADASVRRAAAYALGQTGDSTAVDSLRVRVVLEPDGQVRRYVQEALGRCVTRRTLPELWRVEVLTDTARAAAQAWGLQRAAIRGLASAESIRRAVLLLNAEKPLPDRARLAAVVALARTPKALNMDLSRLAGAALLRLVAKEKYYAVRAAAAAALGKVVDAPPLGGGLTVPDFKDETQLKAIATLLRLATKDADYRVRVTALRALSWVGRHYATSRPAVFGALDDSREPVALTAAEWLLAHARGETGADLAQQAQRLKFWRVRATLLAAALKTASPASRPSLAASVQTRYAALPARAVYERGALLLALAEVPTAATFSFLEQERTQAGQSPVVAGYALTAQVALRRQADFPAALAGDFATAMRGALASGDVNQIGLAAEALADAKLYPEAKAEDLAALHDAQAKLQLPRDIEAWQGLQTALDRLEKAAKPMPAPLGTAQQHPIDWALVQQIPQNQPVRLRTTQGDIVLELKVNEAPGSVANFVSLARQHFYDSLYFHRVVPNFVAQGGDPRGDGSGSAPYTLRSEFGELRYQEGSLGLASAGKDTESCQFFITHGPTPHLDGRYTIFAQVVKGLDVVHRLEIGDRILGVELLQLP
ncbi:peptidylprolyl isomerase [Hymenobacter sp. ASUV-10]|uniref:peptidylprolyl isomerase n=1 Tax=Hymenobacter aranciens TaxID=3063996 RepID=A0ABT9BC42_9BACT|nr:peptidylprolyl isomerase [Hymenobacter sp. ASUV-10]MDO7874123.1 peptidylprolyl isomerase [Hymenobacter sp. ASUV-10]